MPRRLGQHFLANTKTLRDIAVALELQAGETVVEIGPGHGELTDEILRAEQDIRIIAIERDTQLVLALGKKYENEPRIEIVRGDALDVLPKLSTTYHLPPTTWKLVGNIPYYITGHLLRTIGELADKPTRTILTIQREVAERAAAVPPDMNRLAASVQFWAEPTVLQIVPRSNFRPAPSVDSAIILLRARSEALHAPSETYYSLVRHLFAQPRKTIRNNLRGHFSPETIAQGSMEAGVSLGDRPQDLSIDQITTFAKRLRSS